MLIFVKSHYCRRYELTCISICHGEYITHFSDKLSKMMIAFKPIPCIMKIKILKNIMRVFILV